MPNKLEGGEPQKPNGATAAPPSVIVNPEDLYYRGKKTFDRWLDTLGLINTALREKAEESLKNTKDSSTHQVAAMFRQISDFIWDQNLLGLNWWTSLFGLSDRHEKIPVQREFNNRLWTHNADGTLNHIRSDDLAPMFAAGKEADWPNLVLTANHARAWKSDDLVELMRGIERLGHDAGGKPLDLYRLQGKEFANRNPKDGVPEVRGKTILALACHTERDIYLNGARLIDRRLDLMEDENRDNPADRTLAHVSPASLRLAKLLFKLTAEPQCGRLIDVDRAKIVEDERFAKVPLVAHQHLISEDVNWPERNPIILRADAPLIAQHIKLVGYSMGANVVTDALRLFYQECKALNGALQVRDRDGHLLRVASDEDIAAIIRNVGLMNIAPGEVPLTEAEKQKLGMKRTTLLNTEDMTAGHLVNPNAEDYDPWQDRLIKIKGGKAESGHSIREALGMGDKCGFIMDPANADKPGYHAAQDAVQAFFASNHQKQAITTLCLAHEADARANALYVQFAPGIGRAEEDHIEADVLNSLHTAGFAGAHIESDLTHRCRSRILLDKDADTPIERDAAALKKCQSAFEHLAEHESGHLYVAHAVADYFNDLITKLEKPVLGTHTAAAAAEGKANKPALKPPIRPRGERGSDKPPEPPDF